MLNDKQTLNYKIWLPSKNKFESFTSSPEIQKQFKNADT